MKLVDLRVNQVREMMGYDVSHISFSWKTEHCENEKKQIQARIRVYEQGTEIFDSGFQKEICLNERPDKARMYFCGLGLYELWINGRKVSDEFLAPGYHSYDLHLQTQTYDVTAYLKEGNNTVRVLTGDVWRIVKAYR